MLFQLKSSLSRQVQKLRPELLYWAEKDFILSLLASNNRKGRLVDWETKGPPSLYLSLAF